ncbi:ABC transporter substrate-binding protein [Oceanobacillus caeni]|uniref:ABC transporter substrate-binding protein n=1 Tax=Oceanobacillus caeni TaxID=405946 RepID=UPI00195ECB29
MNLKKLLFLFITATFILAACSPPSTANKSEGEGTKDSTEEKTEDGKTQITWLQHWVNEQGPDKIYEVKAAFEEKHPDIELVIEDIPFAQEHDKILSLDLSGNPPDVITTSGAWLIEFAEAGIIDPIDDYLTTMSEEQQQQLEGPMLQEYNGHVYGVPITNGTMAMFYNKALLEGAGVEVPTTWEEVVNASIKLTDPDENRYALTGNLAVEPPTAISYEVIPFILQAGGKMLEDGKAVFNSPEGVKGLEFLNELMNEHEVMTPGAFNAGEKEKRANFSAGNVAFMFEGPWGVNIQKNLNPDLDFGVAPLPKGVQSGTIALGSVLSITSKSDKKEAAWKFLEFMSSAEGQLLWDQATGFFPYNSKTMEDPYFSEDSYLSVFVDSYKNFDRVEVIDHYLPNADDLRKQFTIEVQNYLSGKKSAQEALDDAAAYWNEALEK